jgi:hypothetical protein
MTTPKAISEEVVVCWSISYKNQRPTPEDVRLLIEEAFFALVVSLLCALPAPDIDDHHQHA